MMTLLGLLAGVALLVWLVRRAGAPRNRAIVIEDADELEAAEAEARDLGATATPEDEPPGSDWGPGAGSGRRR